MNNVPKFGGSEHLLSRMVKTSQRDSNKDHDKFGEMFKHFDYLAAKIRNDHRHDKSIEYTTIDLDKQISSLHKEIIRKYGQRFVSMLEDVDKRKVDDNFKQLLIKGTDTILDEGYLGYIPLQSQEYNKALSCFH